MAGYKSALNDLGVKGKPYPKPTSFAPTKAPTVRKASLKPAQQKLHTAQRVGLLGSPQTVGGIPKLPSVTKVAAKKIVAVRPHMRVYDDGKMVRVVGHSRKEDEEEKKQPSLLSRLTETKPKAKTKSEYKSVRDEDVKSKHAKDMALYNAWNDGGRKAKDLRPLLKRFRGLIESKARVYKGRGVPIPDEAIDAEFRAQFVKALAKYDPEQASLGTYIYHQLNAAKRFISTHQNATRIPETRIYMIGEYQSAQSYLGELYGRDPSDDEMADFMGWKLKDVVRLSTELRRDLTTSGFEADPSSLSPSREREVLNLLKYELSADERKVFAFLVGTDGKKEEQSTNVIAKKTGMSIYKVSRMRKAIAKKAQQYLK